MKTDQNLANCHGMAMVFPTFRGTGYGRQLTRAIVAEAGRKERMRISFDLPADSPFESLAEASGLKLVMRAKRSRLLISDIDVDLMGQWVARASERAGDYELLELTTPLPQEHVEEFVELMHVMNSAPFEDYEMEDEKFTVENWREREALISARGESLILQIARHRPSGQLAGYTAINNQSLYPQQAWQWDTGVDPEHRNKGLGRWLKAANALRMLEEFPLVDRVDTYNAGSNEPMLNINVEMGFKPILVEHVYQGPVESVARWAADR
jgi:GNAT superfamily N-acetyltransferase